MKHCFNGIWPLLLLLCLWSPISNWLKKELFAVVCKYVCIDAVNTVHNLMLSFYVFNELMLFPWLFWYHVGRKNEDKYIFDVSMSCCESIWVN